MRPLKLGGDFGSVRAGWRGLRGRRCAISRRGRLDGGRPWATKGEGPGQGSVLRRGALPALSLLLTAGLVGAKVGLFGKPTYAEYVTAPAMMVNRLPDSPPAELPEVATPREGMPFRFEVEAWWTWMDPLDHVNHPAYVDRCDEGISRRMAAAARTVEGGDPNPSLQ